MNPGTKKYNSLFRFSEAKNVTTFNKIILLALVFAGFISILKFADWWFREDHIGVWWMYILLSVFFWYSISRLILIWTNYLRIKKAVKIDTPRGLSVAIYTTSSPGEPLEMFEKTLEACSKIEYPHTTYLLDDTKDPAFKACAEKHGAVWLELIGIPGAKAGKINAALKLTSEEIILVLDPDHIPFPNFFEHTLGYFNEPKIGFVQVAQAYYNQYRSFTARGAAEQTYTFYGPTQMGLFGIGSAVVIGSNCTFRRIALESINGHGIGLAEDLITSIRLHAKGWKSIYNPVVVSRGLVPEDFGSFCKQQLKWSRGVFEVTFQEIPNLFKHLTGWQKLAYLTIGTYYIVGVSSFFFTLLPFIFFLTKMNPAQMDFTEFLANGIPIVAIAILIYLFVQRWMSHRETETGLHWRGMILKYASWPVFFLGFLLSIVDADIPYIPTAKRAVKGFFSPFARPLIVHVILFIGSVFFLFSYRRFYMSETNILETREITWAMIGFALISFLMSIGGIYAALEKLKFNDDPWDHVDVNKLN